MSRSLTVAAIAAFTSTVRSAMADVPRASGPFRNLISSARPFPEVKERLKNGSPMIFGG